MAAEQKLHPGPSPIYYDRTGARVLWVISREDKGRVSKLELERELAEKLSRRCGKADVHVATFSAPQGLTDPRISKLFEIAEAECVWELFPDDEAVLSFSRQCAEALDQFHRFLGRAHLDVSPSNIGRSLQVDADSAIGASEVGIESCEERKDGDEYTSLDRKLARLGWRPAPPPRPVQAKGPLKLIDTELSRPICRNPSCRGCTYGATGTPPFMSFSSYKSMFCPSPFDDYESMGYLLAHLHCFKQRRRWLAPDLSKLSMEESKELKRKWILERGEDDMENKIRAFVTAALRAKRQWMKTRRSSWADVERLLSCLK